MPLPNRSDSTIRLAALLIVAGITIAAQAQSSVTLAWDPSAGNDIAGYRLYAGPASRTYTNVITVGNVTSNKVSGLVSGATYFFAVTAYTTNGLESALSDEITWPTNSPPVISLTSPANGALYTAPASINLAASVTANGHTITQVQFYNGAILIGVATAPPYSLSWANVDAGTCSLSANAIYDSGSKVASATVSATVAAAEPAPAPPPPPGTTFAADSGAISGSFVASSGTISQSAGTSLANAGRAVYSFEIANAGNYLVSAMVRAPSEGQNSFYVNIDAEPTDPLMIWDIPVCTTLTSSTVSWRGNGNGNPVSSQYAPKVFTLSAGTHQLIILGREANTRLGTITIAAAPPKIQIRAAPGGAVVLSGTGQPGQTYNVLCSEDLKAWTVIGTVTADASGSFQFTDPAASSRPMRMYRLQSVTVILPRLQIRAVPGGGMALSGTGQPGQSYGVLRSQDLKTWTLIGTVTVNATGSFTFTDPAGSSGPNGFYRLQGQ